jgi:hypothetical protein
MPWTLIDMSPAEVAASERATRRPVVATTKPKPKPKPAPTLAAAAVEADAYPLAWRSRLRPARSNRGPAGPGVQPGVHDPLDR